MADCETGQCPPSEDPLDPMTFTPPTSRGSQTPSVVIEFCNRCRWLHRATWVQTELFLTFPDTSEEEATTSEERQSAGGAAGSSSKYETGGKGLKSITLIPCNAPDTGGRFRVWLYKGQQEEEDVINQRRSSSSRHQTVTYANGQVVMLWDRKIKAGFPELKELKQLIRDEIAPSHRLGHSDRKTETK